MDDDADAFARLIQMADRGDVCLKSSMADGMTRLELRVGGRVIVRLLDDELRRAAVCDPVREEWFQEWFRWCSRWFPLEPLARTLPTLQALILLLFEKESASCS